MACESAKSILRIPDQIWQAIDPSHLVQARAQLSRGTVDNSSCLLVCLFVCLPRLDLVSWLLALALDAVDVRIAYSAFSIKVPPHCVTARRCHVRCHKREPPLSRRTDPFLVHIYLFGSATSKSLKEICWRRQRVIGCQDSNSVPELLNNNVYCGNCGTKRIRRRTCRSELDASFFCTLAKNVLGLGLVHIYLSTARLNNARHRSLGVASRAQ